MRTPLLSIIIPTKNRPQLCIESVRAILAYDGDFEVVVVDSSSVPLVREDLPLDQRCLLEIIPSETNITQCFEAALEFSSGQFVCVIGDDDGITPALLQWARIAAQRGLDSVSTTPRSYAMYNWPDIRSKYFGDSVAGLLYYKLAIFEEKSVDLGREVREFLAGGTQGCGIMPRVYHGLVSMEAVRRMRQKYGACFAGVSPDVSFSVLAASVVKNHTLIAAPLTISGASGASNAGRSARREHVGDLWSDPHMKYFQNETWPDVIPKFFSVETVWGEAGWKACELIGDGALRAFDLGRFYSILSARHPGKGTAIRVALMAAKAVSPERLDVSTSRIVLRRIQRLVVEALLIASKVLRRLVKDRDVLVQKMGSIREASLRVAELVGPGDMK